MLEGSDYPVPVAAGILHSHPDLSRIPKLERDCFAIACNDNHLSVILNAVKNLASTSELGLTALSWIFAGLVVAGFVAVKFILS